ncbi:MAG: hypothetical protein ABI639_14500 [Thermoanaerobaculia bacterium]
MRALLAIVGITATFLFFRWALELLGAFMCDWADVAGDEVPRADHPYEPNGGVATAPPFRPLAIVAPAGSSFEALQQNGHSYVAPLGRGKDNDEQLDTAGRLEAVETTN